MLSRQHRRSGTESEGTISGKNNLGDHMKMKKIQIKNAPAGTDAQWFSPQYFDINIVASARVEVNKNG